MRGHHRALVIESCLIAAALAFLAGALATTVPAATLAVGVALAGMAAAVFTAAATSDARLAGAVVLWALFLPGWLVYARTSRHVWAFRSAEVLVIGTILATALTFHAYRHYVEDSAAARAARLAREATRERRQWSELLAGLGAGGVECTSITPTRAGRVVAFTLPRDGSVPLRRLESFADNIAAARRLPPAAVTWTMGAHGGEALLHLDEHDSLAGELLFPPGVQVLTIRQPVTLGRRADGTPARVLLRELSVFLSGVTGAGKTNLLNVLIAKLTQCTDVVVFVIDLAGGRLAAPWITPWVEGRCGEQGRPAIDWVATTRAEAWEMLQAVQRMMEARDASLLGGSKITPTDDTPQVVVIIDETADVTGTVPKGDQQGVSPVDAADVAAKLTRRVRKAAIMMVWALTRGTADNTGSTMIKSQCKMRWSMGVSGEIDARQVTDSNAVARLLASAQHPGSLVIEYPGHREPVLVKAYRLDSSFPEDARRIDELAQHAGTSRPRPSSGDRAAMGKAYAERWDRSDLYQRLLADFHHRTGQAPLPPVPGQAVQEAVAVLDVNTAARAIFEAEGLAATDNPRERMYALLAERRMLGMSVMEIAGALNVDRTTVHRWLRDDDLPSGKIVKRGDGKAARYFLGQPE